LRLSLSTRPINAFCLTVQDKACCRSQSFHRSECHPKSCRAKSRSRASTTWHIWRKRKATTSWPYDGETKTWRDLLTSSAYRRIPAVHHSSSIFSASENFS